MYGDELCSSESSFGENYFNWMKKLLILNGAFLLFALIARFFFLEIIFIFCEDEKLFLNYLYDFVGARDSAAAIIID